MNKIAIGDWFLARSDAFRHLMTKFRDHKIATANAFKKVKAVHRKHEQRFLEHEAKIRTMERILMAVQEAPSPTKIIRRRNGSLQYPKRKVRMARTASLRRG